MICFFRIYSFFLSGNQSHWKMGVITTGVIPAGKTFGPIPPNLTLTDPALLIGHMTCDNRPDVHTVKVCSSRHFSFSIYIFCESV